MTTVPAAYRAPRPTRDAALAIVAVVTIALIVTVRNPTASLVVPAVAAAGLAATLWMMTSRRLEVTLGLLLLYLGLADGYLKLSTGHPLATLARDVLLYAVVAGALLRLVARRAPLALPPLTLLVGLFVVVVLLQVPNPSSGPWRHAIESVRPHLEFVPLFFLGFAVMRTRDRLRGFLILMLIVTAVNGVVGFVQFNQTTEQLANWGPGYAERIEGSGDVSDRTYVGADGEKRTRPFGLGSDFGFGGILGLLAAPGALALVSLRRRPGTALVALVLLGGTVTAVATSQARTAVLGTVLGVLAFVALVTPSARVLRTVTGLAIVAFLGIGLVPQLQDASGTGGTFERYESVTPDKALETTYDYRSQTLAQIPGYAARFPLGAGLGSVGPAAGEFRKPLDAESEFTFLLIELGIAGLVILLVFNVRVIVMALRRIRSERDPDLRILLAAIAAPLLALLGTWIVGAPTATSPASPFMWFAAGTLVYWARAGRLELAPPQVVEQRLASPPPALAILPAPPRRAPEVKARFRPTLGLLLPVAARRARALPEKTRRLVEAMAKAGQYELVPVPVGRNGQSSNEPVIATLGLVVVPFAPGVWRSQGLVWTLPLALRALRGASKRPILILLACGPARARTPMERLSLALLRRLTDLTLTDSSRPLRVSARRRVGITRRLMPLPWVSQASRLDRPTARARLGVGRATFVAVVFTRSSAPDPQTLETLASASDDVHLVLAPPMEESSLPALADMFAAADAVVLFGDQRTDDAIVLALQHSAVMVHAGERRRDGALAPGYSSGAIVARASPERAAAVIRQLVTQPAELERRSRAARELFATTFEPEAALSPLLDWARELRRDAEKRA